MNSSYKERDSEQFWNILIVDDDSEVHKVTEFALEELTIDEKELRFISAHNEDEAVEMLNMRDDIAVILLDVVMNHNDSGFTIIKHLRENLANYRTRVIIRTGQPGIAPEDEVILKYEINDYTNKTELTQSRLVVSVVSAIRSYRDISKIEQFNQTLQAEVEAKTNELREINAHLNERIKEEIEKSRSSESLLIQRSKMADMGELLRVIIHQLNQPLAAIELLSENIDDTLEVEQIDSETIQNHTKDIRDQVEFMDRTMRELRGFLKPSQEKALFDIVQSIRFILGILTPILREQKISTSINLKEEDATNMLIEGYESELKHLFLNICNNAIDAIVANNSTIREINFTIWSEDEYLFIEVEDSGGGIEEEILEKIFEHNFSTKAERGTGIGLYLAKKIIENHIGGSIKARNSQKGAIFSINLKRHLTA